jgi:hypothetical protein
MGFKSKNDLPRHVEAKRLADGDLAYYWRVPPAARMANCSSSAPLGRNLDHAKQVADELNAAFDRAWRRGEVRDLLGIPNGFLSSVEREGNKNVILSE